MKLDRNINPDGRGKYALINLRKLDRYVESRGGLELEAVRNCIEELDRRGLISWGHESPGDQFFVIKYKDEFAAPALRAYADAIKAKVAELHGKTLVRPMGAYAALEIDAQKGQIKDLMEYAEEIDREAQAAEKVANKKLPD